MKSYTSKIINAIFHISVFSLINIPSIKIIYSSQIVNIGVIIIILIFGTFRLVFYDGVKIKTSHAKIIFTIFYTMLWGILAINSFLQQTITSTLVFIEYVIPYFITLALIVFVKKNDLKPIIFLQILWALLLSIGQLMGKINLNINLGQHYLTLGVPIACGIVCIIGLLFLKRSNIIESILLIIFSIICFLALTTLDGRSPILLSILTPIVIVLLSILLEKNLLKKFNTTVILIVSSLLIFNIVFYNVSDLWLNRFLGLSDFTNEPRYLLYSTSIKMIKNNIFGYGLNKFSIGSYPHNIFLEIGVSGGVLALSIFFLILVLFVVQIIQSVKKKNNSFPIIFLSLFFFLVWNISFDLKSSYIPFAGIIFTLVASEKNTTITNAVKRNDEKK